jgi:flagellar M-ring protein FliF
MKQLWTNLDRRGQAVLAGGAILAAMLLVLCAVWLARTDYQVLFTDLKPQDTAAMVAELERQKIPYRIGGDGNTILAPADTVHATRLKLMGKDIALHGAAGFELFNNADFGMTEFAQKINYQRALQGEITRTILSLAEVRDARVHLALPEEGLFKRGTVKGKAAITLSLKAGASLRAEQVTGIQRLVAASVPGIAAQDVTILDQRGVALTRAPGDGEMDLGSGRLDLKKETEQLLARKAGDVLDRALGMGQAIASVDVTLNMDVVRTTSEEVLGGPGRGGQSTGVLVREREVMRETGVAPLDQRQDGRSGNTQREVEYQTGRRVEQVVTQPGAIRRMHVVAVVSKAMDAQQLEQVRALVAAAVGVVAERGDAVVVQSLKAFGTAPATPENPPSAAPAANEALAGQARPEPVASSNSVLGVVLLLAAAVIAVCIWMVRRERTPAVRVLSNTDRETALRQLQVWLHANDEGIAVLSGASAVKSAAGERS